MQVNEGFVYGPKCIIHVYCTMYMFAVVYIFAKKILTKSMYGYTVCILHTRVAHNHEVIAVLRQQPLTSLIYLEKSWKIHELDDFPSAMHIAEKKNSVSLELTWVYLPK